MMYREIECPTCGNEVMAESTKLPQKCPWCKRLFKVRWSKQGRKVNWEVQTAEFNRPNKSFSKFEMSQEGLQGYEESAATLSDHFVVSHEYNPDYDPRNDWDDVDCDMDH